MAKRLKFFKVQRSSSSTAPRVISPVCLGKFRRDSFNTPAKKADSVDMNEGVVVVVRDRVTLQVTPSKLPPLNNGHKGLIDDFGRACPVA